MSGPANPPGDDPPPDPAYQTPPAPDPFAPVDYPEPPPYPPPMATGWYGPPPPGMYPPPYPMYPMYPPYPPAAAPDSMGSNGKAIASIVCGAASLVLCMCYLPALAAMVLGAIALAEIGRSGQAGQGLAIGGIVLGALSLLMGVAITFTG